MKKHPIATDHTKKIWILKKKIPMIFLPLPGPPGVPHISAQGSPIKKRLDESSNLAQSSIHAKFQLIWTIRLVRAWGVVT